MNKPRDKPIDYRYPLRGAVIVNCRNCRHSSNEENHMVYCSVKRVNRSLGSRQCADFEEKKVDKK